MGRDIPLLIFFTIVTVSHALFIIYAKSLKQNAPRFRLWNIHYLANSALWFMLTLWILIIQSNSRDTTFPFYTEILGLLLCILGFVLTADGLIRLGFKQAMGYRFFSPNRLPWTSKGSYSFLHNPMYDGFILIFLGLGLLRGIFIDFYLAVVSFMLLNIFLASVENKEIKITAIL